MFNRIGAIVVPLFFVLCALDAGPVAFAATASIVETAASKRHTVTLLSSFEPIPDSLVPSDFPGPLRVYHTQAVVFGKTIYFVRVGFFASTAEAEITKARLTQRYPGAFVTEVTPEELARARGARPAAPAPLIRPAAPATPPTPKPRAAEAPAMVETEAIYVVVLRTSENRAPQPIAPLPDALRDDRLYQRESTEGGKRVSALNLGFYPNVAQAERARRLLLGAYPLARVRGATARERVESLNSVVAYIPPKSAPTAAVAPAPKPAADSKLDQQATELMEKARAALTGGNTSVSIDLLNLLLRLPPNKQSQDAQELIGLAHERNNEMAIARKEYELYLKLYPEGETTERVRQRLANLEILTSGPRLKAAKKRTADITTAYGSLSQYYYRGDSKVDVTDKVTPTLDQPALTSTDLSALFTDFDITGRMRAGDWDNRVVVRNLYKLDFLDSEKNYNRLYSAYAEVRNKTSDYGGRLGRQPGNGGGVLGRFDGLSFGYGLTPKWRVNMVAGEPVEYTPINSDKLFWGTNVDFGTFAEHWNGNVYYVQQTVDGILDRQAVGSELRFFHPKGSFFLLADYDLSYSELNITTLQTTWQLLPSTSFNLTADRRHSPLLQTSNAVIGEIDSSIKSQLLTLTEEHLRAQAVDRTAVLNLYLAGVTHTINPIWQLGGNVQFFNLSGTPASGSRPAIPDSGDTLIYTVQGIGNGLFSRKHDISVLSLSYITNPAYDGTSVAISNRAIYQDRWTVDLSLRYYQQASGQGVNLTRYTPQARLGYRWRDHLTLEAEVGIEKSSEDSADTSTETTNHFYTLGYRWEF